MTMNGGSSNPLIRTMRNDWIVYAGFRKRPTTPWVAADVQSPAGLGLCRRQTASHNADA
jgi:hypothetical protein